MLERIFTDFRPTRVLGAGPRADEFAAALRPRGVQVQLLHELEPAAAKSAAGPHFDLSIGLDLGESGGGRTDADAVTRTLAALCQHSDIVLFSVWDRGSRLVENDLHPSSFWVTQCAQLGFYRDVDYDAAGLGAGVLCVRRLDGSHIPILAAYERMLGQRERELSAQHLLSQEYRTILRERDLEIEDLQNEVEANRLNVELRVLRSRVAPSGTTRERYLNTALGGLRQASRVALRGLALGDRLAQSSKALLRGRSGI